MARFWKTAVFIAATAYFVVDGALSYVTRPMTAWMAKRNLFERTRLWILSFARASSGPGHRPGTGKASGGIFDGKRSVRRGCDYVYRR
jgi:hypothetical protein